MYCTLTFVHSGCPRVGNPAYQVILLPQGDALPPHLQRSPPGDLTRPRGRAQVIPPPHVTVYTGGGGVRQEGVACVHERWARWNYVRPAQLILGFRIPWPNILAVPQKLL